MLDNLFDEFNKNIEFDPLHYTRQIYIRSFTDPNQLPFWFSKIKNAGFRVPETKIIQMPLELFREVYKAACDDYENQLQRERLLDFVKANWDVTSGNLKITDKLFFRTGISSCKFAFDNACVVNDPSEIPECVFHTVFDAACQDKPESCYLVFREFIETDTGRPTIYHGQKLNTEFRVFYDFEEHRILGCFNYWGDRDAMLALLRDEEADNYNKAFSPMEDEFNRLRPSLEELCTKNIGKIKMKDKWSIDFMWTGKEFVLIDMALARNSYFGDRIDA